MITCDWTLYKTFKVDLKLKKRAERVFLSGWKTQFRGYVTGIHLRYWHVTFPQLLEPVLQLESSTTRCTFIEFGFLLSILPTWERASSGRRSSFWRVCFVELEEQAEVKGRRGIDKERISKHVLSISGIG